MTDNERKEVKRIKDWWDGDTECIKCGKNIHLWFNGGELDQQECCGLLYATEIQAVDLIIREVK